MTALDTTAAGSNDTSRTSYEELRSRVLTGSANGRNFALLLREGLAAWLAQRSACPTPATPDVQRCGPELVVFDEIDVSLVRVLASMALAGQREMSA